MAQLSSRTRLLIPTPEEVFRKASASKLAFADRDLDEALKLFEQGRLTEEQVSDLLEGIRYGAQTGDIELKQLLAQMIHSGVIRPEDPKEGLRYALEAAEAGNAEAAL